VALDLHAVERNRRLAAQALGYRLEGPCDFGLQAAGDLPVPARRPYALLLTMTSRADKLWSEERWQALGVALAQRGLQCLLPWGSVEERERCARLAAAIPGAEVPRRMTIGELARLARDAGCVAGVDTGLAHLAAAFNVPVVGIYCGSDPALTGLHGSPRVRNLGSAGRPPGSDEVIDALRELTALEQLR
jgi:heptosyltransferase-1